MNMAAFDKPLTINCCQNCNCAIVHCCKTKAFPNQKHWMNKEICPPAQKPHINPPGLETGRHIAQPGPTGREKSAGKYTYKQRIVDNILNILKI